MCAASECFYCSNQRVISFYLFYLWYQNCHLNNTAFQYCYYLEISTSISDLTSICTLIVHSVGQKQHKQITWLPDAILDKEIMTRKRKSWKNLTLFVCTSKVMKEKGRQDETQIGDQGHMTIPFQVVFELDPATEKWHRWKTVKLQIKSIFKCIYFNLI